MSANTGDLLGVITLAGKPESVAAAREFVRSVLGDAHPALDDARLLTSELFTNSAVHSDSRDGGDIRIEISGTPGRGTIRVGVIDKGAAGKPYVRDASDDVSGRGLFLVDALCDRWGVNDHECAREVWFEIGRGDTCPDCGDVRNGRKC
ncbi:ATP-binding protein [Thermopolyspora sp. NPDC052614]|uniref:ATP-binding protein n=1 Tax=Thermopolyspora sp. NPDC052614 TaxID=3155682 RepID=UPI0034273490